MLNDIKSKLDVIQSKIQKNEYDVIEDLRNLLELSLNNDAHNYALACITKIIYIHGIKGEFEEQKAFLAHGDVLLEKEDIDAHFHIDYLANKAHVITMQGKANEAMILHVKTLELCEKIKDVRGVVTAQMQIGDHYFNLKEYTKANQYLQQALQNALDNTEEKRLWLVYCKLGYNYHEWGKQEEAKKALLTCCEEAEKLDHKVGKVLGSQNLSEVELILGNQKEAKRLCDYALKVCEQNVGLNQFYNSLIFTKVKINLAAREFHEGITLLDEVSPRIKNERFQLALNELYIEAYEGAGDYKTALKHFRNFIESKEKIYGLEVKKHTEDLEAKYQNELKEREKEILRLQKIEMEQKAIRAQLNPHFFFNALNSINKFILDNDQQNASKFLQNFSGLMRKTLENSEEMFISIEDEIEFLKDYLSLEQLRCNNSFQFEFNVDEEIEEDFVKIPTMLLQPYVENAIKHGVNGVEKGKIIVSFRLTEDENVFCVVEDNGPGIGVVKKTLEHKSMATKLLRERMKALQEQFNLAFEIKTQNLSDLNNGNTGTRVELLIPKILL